MNGFVEDCGAVKADNQVDEIIKKIKVMQEKKCVLPCPRCGQDKMSHKDPARNALSRFADVYICDDCGTDEALRDFFGCSIPLENWKMTEWF